MRRSVVLALVSMAAAAPAAGQLAFSATAESQVRFRGVPLSDGKPDLRLNLDYDAAAGGYAGGAATQVRLRSGRRQGEWLVYAGYAQRTQAGPAWEIGCTRAHFDAEPRYDYGEFFVGWIGERWSARSYLSPSYFGNRLRTLYAELNGGIPLDARWRLLAHFGAIDALNRVSAHGPARASVDSRLGIGLSRSRWEFQFARVDSSRGSVYPVAYADRRGAWVLSATWSP